jgi:hypothetical protein
MMTLASDMLTLIKVGFSMEDLVREGPMDSILEQILPPGKAIQSHAGLYSAMGWDDAYQEALYPLLSATFHRSV